MIIEITAKLGSNFQKQFASSIILNTLLANQLYLLSSHKNNYIEIKIDGVLIQNIKKDTNIFENK